MTIPPKQPNFKGDFSSCMWSWFMEYHAFLPCKNEIFSFSQKRKRRAKDDDVVSLSSLDLKVSLTTLAKEKALRNTQIPFYFCTTRRASAGGFVWGLFALRIF